MIEMVAIDDWKRRENEVDKGSHPFTKTSTCGPWAHVKQLMSKFVHLNPISLIRSSIVKNNFRYQISYLILFSL